MLNTRQTGAARWSAVCRFVLRSTSVSVTVVNLWIDQKTQTLWWPCSSVVWQQWGLVSCNDPLRMGPHVPGQWCRVGIYCPSCTDTDAVLIVVPKVGSLSGMQGQHTQSWGIPFNCGSVQERELGGIPQKNYLFVIPPNFITIPLLGSCASCTGSGGSLAWGGVCGWKHEEEHGSTWMGRLWRAEGVTWVSLTETS